MGLEKRTTQGFIKGVLDLTYRLVNVGSDEEFIRQVTDVVLDPAKREFNNRGMHLDYASHAVEEVYNLLRARYRGISFEASATTDLFYALEREKELGWVLREVNRRGGAWEPSLPLRHYLEQWRKSQQSAQPFSPFTHVDSPWVMAMAEAFEMNTQDAAERQKRPTTR